MIVYNRRINMVPGEVPVFIHMSQYDSDITLEFELYASEGTFVVENGTTVLIRGTKPDGNGISLDGTLESTQDPETGQYVHLVTVEVTQQMTAVAGKSLYELSLRYDGEELNTANFVLDIERAPLDRDTLPSESEIKELADVAAVAADLIEAAHAIEDAMLTDSAKEALLNCLAHVAWADGNGNAYVSTLRAALYEGTTGHVSATYTPGTHVVYTTDSLDSLRPYLTVVYRYGNRAPAEVTAYTLSGDITTAGTRTITVGYEGVYTTVDVAVVASTGLLYNWDFTKGLTDERQGVAAVLASGAETLPTIDAQGVHISAAKQGLKLLDDTVPITWFANKTISVDVTSFVPDAAITASKHVRFIAFHHVSGDNSWYDTGLIYRGTGNNSGATGWSIYKGTAWGSVDLFDTPDLAAFSGHTVNLYLDPNLKPSLYIDGVQKGTQTTSFGNYLMGLMIGSTDLASSNSTFFASIIAAVRIYDGEVAR